MRDPSTHLCRFEANCAKIQYVVDPCPKMNRPSFCLIILKHFLMHWMVCSVYYLGWMVVNISELFAEWSITERDVTTFRYCCLGFFLAWNPLFIFRYRCSDGHFPGFVNTYFLRIRLTILWFCLLIVLSALVCLI